MQEKPLLLSAAKTAVLVQVQSREARLRLAALCVGVVVVLVGAADITSRVAHSVFNGNAGAVAFAPAVAALDPHVLGGTATTSDAIVPARLRIPAIGVNAPVEQVAQKSDGTMGTPTKFGDVAWYAPGAKPGASGSAVFAGHVDNALTTAGVFEHLADLKVGDYVVVEDAQGKAVAYRVVSTTTYPANQAPLAQIFAASGPAQLVLITCTGDWVTSQKQFDQRLVVVATPAY